MFLFVCLPQHHTYTLDIAIVHRFALLTIHVMVNVHIWASAVTTLIYATTCQNYLNII